MNKFGGHWTELKIEILVEYAKAYLTIMNQFADKYNWKLIYFDGFAGSGFIEKGKDDNIRRITGAATRILEIDEPRPFDIYYFVEKEKGNADSLEQITKEYTNKTTYVINTDCNEKIESMGKFLESKEGKKHKVLAYIDPCGMQLKWSSLMSIKESKVDAWILVPTGMGVNRLLKNDGKILDAWLERLETFLGMDKDAIKSYFYSENVVQTLFGDEVVISKETKAIEKSAVLYQDRLETLFDYVSKPYILKNSTNSIMFHLYMVSNNKTAVRIANEIIRKYNKI